MDHRELWRFPMHCPPTPGRIALVDGDGLAYTQAGPDGTTREQARQNLANKLSAVRRASGAESVVILVTGAGSHKGRRYAVATVKSYQGQRSSSRRPEQWEYLRGVLDTHEVMGCQVMTTYVAEADDLFSHLSHKHGAENVVIVTQDKDLRMVPGWHLTWDDHMMLFCGEGENLVYRGKPYGMRWFWLQMLHGDTADHVPGLPKYEDGGKMRLIGEVTAGKMLAGLSNNECAEMVGALYQSYWKDHWRVAMMEQGILLWMRRRPVDVFDVASPEYGPLVHILDAETRAIIKERYDPTPQAE